VHRTPELNVSEDAHPEGCGYNFQITKSPYSKTCGYMFKTSHHMNATVTPMKTEDWEDVRSIYREGIETGYATFETKTPGWEAWDKSHLDKCRLVARLDGQMVGWAALSPVSDRCTYAGVAEVSLYVRASARGQGVGKVLLLALIEESERAGIWTLQGGVFPENLVSIALQKSCGFREVGRREKLGRMNGVWRDVLLFERRSKIVGT
jgi:L-amino acid N-acyltransferase YncA